MFFKCPRSYKNGCTVGGGDSEESAEGTEAHKLAADALNALVEEIEPDTRLPEGVRTSVNAFLRACYADLTPERYLYVEKRVAAPDVHPLVYGTVDCAIYDTATRKLWVKDYKHGEGVYVSAAGNLQTRYYALCMMSELAREGLPVEAVHIQIVQPRFRVNGRPNINGETLTAFEMFEFEMELRAAIEAAHAEEPEARPDVETCQFASNKLGCAAYLAAADAGYQDGFGSPDRPPADYPDMDLAELARRLDAFPLVRQYMRAVEAYAWKLARERRLLPKGYTLKPTLGPRKWGVPIGTVERIARKIDPAIDVYERAAKTPPQLEKELGEELFAGLAHLIERKPGATFVRSDKYDGPPADIWSGGGAEGFSENGDTNYWTLTSCKT